MTCPITQSCYKVLVEHFFQEKKRFLYEDLADQYSEIKKEIAQEPEPTHVVRLLRGFWATELVYLFLLPQTAREITHLNKKLLMRRRYERSHRGMEELLHFIQGCKRRLLIDVGVLDLMNTSSNQEKRFRSRHMKNLLPLFEATEEMIIEMKKGLVNKCKLTKVGDLLGAALIKAGTSPERCINYMQILLTITPDNSISPWPKTYSDSPE